MKHSTFGVMLITLLVLVGITSCIGFGLLKVTGRGTIPSAYHIVASPGNGATFSFGANSCDDVIKGRFNYQDKYFPVTFNGESVKGGVIMNGNVIEVITCLGPDSGYYLCDACRNSFDYAPPFVAIAVDYRSANPFAPGEGFADVCILEKGEGVGAKSEYRIAIRAENGPFAGYSNKGEAKGKIQSHTCK